MASRKGDSQLQGSPREDSTQQESQQQDSHQQDSQQQKPQQQESHPQDSQHQDPQQQDPVSRSEPLDADEVPPEYQGDTVASSRGRRSKNVGRNDTRRQSIPRDPCTPPSREATRRDAGRGARSRPAPPSSSPSFASRLTGMLPWSHRRASMKGGSGQHEQDGHRMQHDAECPEVEFHGVDGTSEQMLMYENDIMMEGQQSFQEFFEFKEHEWEERERQLQRHISQITRYFEESSHNLQAKLRQSESERLAMEEKHNAFVLKQQEATFGQMVSARWLPMDEGKVMHELDRLKTDMRSWAKATSFKDNSRLQSFAEAESANLLQDLTNVTLVEDGQLPDGLSTIAKSPMLLLNALLAHNVYTSFFRSPFFFLGNNDPTAASNSRPERILEDIYDRAQTVNQQDAHMWRSQTLRLLMPPLRNGATEADAVAENRLRRTTEDSIAQAADRQAAAFLASPARYLIDGNVSTVLTNKLNKIYSDAAKLSYMLWTRRTQMRCFTLREIQHLDFDHESSDFDPDNLVRFDDHEDHLKGRTVTVIVHPLLRVYGTDEAKDYHQGRVWAKGVVWLDSKKSPV